MGEWFLGEWGLVSFLGVLVFWLVRSMMGVVIVWLCGLFFCGDGHGCGLGVFFCYLKCPLPCGVGLKSFFSQRGGNVGKYSLSHLFSVSLVSRIF